MSVTPKPGAGSPVSRAGTMVVKKTASKALLALAPYLVPVLIVLSIIAAGVIVVAVAASAAGAQYSGADAKAQQAAVAAGLPEDQLGSVRAVANSYGIPWQILAALHTVGGSTAPVSTPAGSAVSESALSGNTVSPDRSASPSTTATATATAAATATATTTADPPAPTAATTTAPAPTPAASATGTPSAPTGQTLTLDPGSELVRTRFGSDTPRPTQVDQFLGGLLADDMTTRVGAGRMKTLTDGTIQSTDGITLLTFPADRTDQLAAQKQAWVTAIAGLPIQGNSDTTAGAVYDEALRLALVPVAQCPATPGATGIVGGGLSTQAAPEPMRSQMIMAGQAYGVPPSVVAALYLTENNGFSFADAYYDNGRNPSAFRLTTTSSEWKLATYGTTGLWPPGGTFRGPFQFGPIWESTYRTPEHPNVLLFADAAFGAAHYMADLGAKDNPTDDAINQAAQSYNGQISWSPGGSSIRNPDPAKFSVVKQLYAFQVVELARALSDSGSGSAGSADGTTSTTSATATTPTAASPASTGPLPTPNPTTITASTTASRSTGCVAGGGGAGGGVQVAADGPQITLPDSLDVTEAARGKTITAPTDGVARGLVAGLKALGLPYVWGGGGSGAGPDDGCARAGGELNSCQGLVGFDCSGLTAYVLGQAGFRGIPGNSGAQRAGGTSIPWEQGLPGDIIGYAGHVAIYLGEIDGVRYMLEAPDVGLKVRVAVVRGGADDTLHRYWS